MGRNSKARRDARKRKAPSAGTARATPGGQHAAGGWIPSHSDGTYDYSYRVEHDGPAAASPYDDFARAEELVRAEVVLLGRASLSREQMGRRVEMLLRRAAPLPGAMLGDALEALLRQLVATCSGTGWLPEDLRQVVRRRAGDLALPRLEQLLGSGAGRSASLHELDEMAVGLTIAGVLATLTEIPTFVATASRATSSSVPEELARKLATVRGLLAKAESTSFDEEAEALTAKAQELISRYALETLLARAEAGQEKAAMTTAHIWLDPPYSDAKASLVSQVAASNRCRSISTSMDLCLVVGDPSDLAYVELLVTSLLVQASRAMTRAGSHVDRSGKTRTRSFRQSFLISFAVRIGQRLLEATAQAVTDHGPDSRLLPAIVDQEERVQTRFDELFPHITMTTTSVTNHAGWAAGAVAADLAQLDVHQPVPGSGTAG